MSARDAETRIADEMALVLLAQDAEGEESRGDWKGRVEGGRSIPEVLHEIREQRTTIQMWVNVLLSKSMFLAANRRGMRRQDWIRQVLAEAVARELDIELAPLLTGGRRGRKT